MVLKTVDKAKYLGVTISNSLSWSHHTSVIAGKANAKIGFLWRNLRHCPKKLKKQANLKKDKMLLERVQHRAARFVTGDSDWTSSVSAMLKDLGWDSLEDRRREIRLAQFYKAVHHLTAIPTDNILVPADERTRNSHAYKYRHIAAKTATYRNSFFPRTVPEWNKLPAHATLPPPPEAATPVRLGALDN